MITSSIALSKQQIQLKKALANLHSGYTKIRADKAIKLIRQNQSNVNKLTREIITMIKKGEI